MPWEKEFNEDEILGKAMQVFWEKGYEAASIADLVSGTGISRGSLYNAFGGKQKLFTKALLKYDRDSRRAALGELEALNDPVKAIVGFFDGIVQETIEDSKRRGCFLVNTASELPFHDAEIESIVTNGLGEIEGFFRRSIEVAQARGEVPTTTDPEATAKTLMGLCVAIRVLGRGAFTEPALQVVARQAQRLVA